MSTNKACNISTLGQVDGVIKITKTEDLVYVIDDCSNIYVASGVYAKFLDNSQNCKIYLESDINSTVDYVILDSKNTNRCFTIKGELKINQIALNDTKESLNVSLTLENSNCNIKCLSIASKNNNEFIQRIDHKNKLTSSNITNVGIVMNKSDILFDTTGKIEKGMSKSKCSQLSRGIVMDDDSQITAKPILLIDEYDCFANHGASIGKMSDDDLFYLMSRGLTKKDAFLLILQGIIKPFIDDINIDEWKNRIDEEIEKLIEK